MPNIEFTKIRQAQIYHPSIVIKGQRPTYEILQIWFSYNPPLPLETSVAKDVTALIRITKSDESDLFEFHGQWAKSNAPDNVGFDDILDSVNIQPGHLEAKLIIALKYPSDSRCYAFTREGYKSTTDGRSERYEIDPGDYTIRFHLRGVGVDKVFWFALHNCGANQSLKLEPHSL